VWSENNVKILGEILKNDKSPSGLTSNAPSSSSDMSEPGDGDATPQLSSAKGVRPVACTLPRNLESLKRHFLPFAKIFFKRFFSKL
jgi:hypothetical protein